MQKFVATFALFLCFGAFLTAQTIYNAMPLSMEPSSNQAYFAKTNAPIYAASARDAGEEGAYDNYGGKLGIGISLGEGLGIPVRYYISPKLVTELGIYATSTETTGLRLDEIDNFDQLEFESSAIIGLGFTYFGNRFLKEKRKRNKVRAHGISARLARGTGDWSSTYSSLGWAMETFRENRTGRSFIFELGLQNTNPNFDFYKFGREAKNNFGVYLRLHWNFFVD